MKIVIIGVNGQLGTDCMNIFSGNHEVFGCDIPEVDISSKDSIEKFVLPIQPDVIINCAAFTAVDACETETELARKINADGPKYLAQISNDIGCKLVHISTDYVFSGNKPIPEFYTEEDSVDPLSQYGVTKLAGELAVLEHCPNNLCLRTAWLYSAYGKNFLKTMLKMALSAPERKFTIVNDQYGSLTWSFTLAKQIEKLLETDITGVVHTTSEGYSTWFEAACYFLDAMEVPYNFAPCTTADYPTPAHRPANSHLENVVLKNAGISVFVDWKKDVDAYVKEFKQTLIEEAQALIQEQQ